MKYYNYNLFHTVSRNFIAQTGDPTGTRNGGESIHGVLHGPLRRYFESEKMPKMAHTHQGLVSFVGNDDGMIGSQFFITLGEDLTYLDGKHCIFGEIMEGLDVIEAINETICDGDNRPYKDIRITHTVVLDDPFPDFDSMKVPSRSPSPSAERLQGGRIGADEAIDDTEGKTIEEVSEIIADREAKARATILEMVGDLPDAEMAPPENVLFVCKLNPVTTDDDLEIIFSRFGKVKSCEVIRDKKSGDSLQYAFVEFEDKKTCEEAYFKMDNVLIDERRIHVDFSQSVSKIRWLGKGRGVKTYGSDKNNDIGKGKYEKTERDLDKSKYHRSNDRRPQHTYDRHSNSTDRYRSRHERDVRREYHSSNRYRDDRRSKHAYENEDRNRRRRTRHESNSEEESRKHRKKQKKSSEKDKRNKHKRSKKESSTDSSSN